MEGFKTKIWGEYIVALLLLLWGMYQVPFAVMGLSLSAIPGDLGDTRFNIYILEHCFQYLTGKTPSWMNMPMMYPEKNTLALSDHLLGNQLLYTPLRLMGINKYSAFQYLIIAVFLFNYLSSWYVLHFKFKYSIIASAVGAYMFTFSFNVLFRLNHFQLIPRIAIPFALYFISCFFWSGSFFDFRKAFAWIVFQFYFNTYTAFFTLLFLIIAFFFTVKKNNYRLIKFNKSATIKFAISILFLIVALHPYLIDIYNNDSRRTWSEVFPSIPSIYSYFMCFVGSIHFNWLNDLRDYPNSFWGNFLFTGIIPYLAIIVSVFFAIRLKERSKTNALLILLLISFLFTLRINDFSLYKIIFHIPGYNSIRMVSRIVLVFIFIYGLLI